MQVYESFIFGMLRNFPVLPLDRMHNMLVMFVPDSPGTNWQTRGLVSACFGEQTRCCCCFGLAVAVQLTSPDLQRILGKLVQDDKLEFDGSVYKLKPESH